MNNGCFELLLIGAGRGGTSLLAGILDAHSRLEIAFEQHAAAYLMGRKLSAEAATNYYERTRTFLSACEDSARHFPNMVWGNKITTEQLRALQKHNAIESHAKIDLLDEFFQRTFQGKKVVFILRDGRSCAISKVNRTGVDIEQACSRWLFSARVYRYLREHEGNWHTLKYEDLVAEPERTTRALCTFLGLEFEPDMLIKGPNSPKMLAEYRQTEIVPKTPIKALPEQYLEQLRGELGYCGYS
ncbi:MAG: sulfotransferase family protein [Pseudomonas sp.]